MRYIWERNKTAQPIKWKYSDPSQRVRGLLSTVTVPLGTMPSSPHVSDALS